MSDHRIIADGLFPSGQELPPTRAGREEVRAAVEALLRIVDRDSARLALALEQLDKGAAEIERLRADNERMAASFVTNQQVIKDAVAAERERCARLAEAIGTHRGRDSATAQDIAAAIRRSEP